MIPIIVLDIDGVLNNHTVNAAANSTSLRHENVTQFNRILAETGADVVLSSAWRYIIAGGDMTLRGFEYLLRTHGVLASVKVIGMIYVDEKCSYCSWEIKSGEECKNCGKISTRGSQIVTWLFDRFPGKHPRPHVVLDDLDLGITECDLPFVQTDGAIGLTAVDADKAIQILKGA